MKSRSDKTISAVIIFYGLFFLSPLFFGFTLSMTTSAYVWFSTWIAFILLGLWKIESFEITNDKLIKRNLCGQFKRTISLSSIIRYDKRRVDTRYSFHNPFIIIRLFTDDSKYFVFRQVIIMTDEGSKIKLDERMIHSKDFNTIYNKIKGSKKRRAN